MPKKRKPAVAPRTINRVRVLDEFAFICDEVYGDNTAQLRTRTFYRNSKTTKNHDERFSLDSINSRYKVQIEKGAKGIIHFYGVRYDDGDYRVIVTNTVFPIDRHQEETDPRAIMLGEVCARLYTSRPPIENVLQQQSPAETTQPETTI